MSDYLDLYNFLVDNWIKPHYPNETDIQIAITEYKRCKRISQDEFNRWLTGEIMPSYSIKYNQFDIYLSKGTGINNEPISKATVVQYQRIIRRAIGPTDEDALRLAKHLIDRLI